MMSNIIFVSGWAGYPQLFPKLKVQTFLLPFLTHTPEDISSLLCKKNGDILIGWSFGAFCIVRDLPRLSTRYKKIFLIAPFNSFYRWHSTHELDKLEAALKAQPQTALNAFWRACACPLSHLVPEKDYSPLLKGLKIVRQSKIQVDSCMAPNLTLVHGCKDTVVPPKSSKELLAFYPEAKTLLLSKKGHWICPTTILNIHHENTNSKRI